MERTAHTDPVHSYRDQFILFKRLKTKVFHGLRNPLTLVLVTWLVMAVLLWIEVASGVQ